MKYSVKFVNESVFNDPNFKPRKKKLPLSMATHRVTVRVKGWEADVKKYSRIPSTTHLTAVVRQLPKNLKQMGFEELTNLFNKNVISPFIPIINWQEMSFYKDGRVWFKRNKIDLI